MTRYCSIDCGEVLGDPVMATAILDRPLHQATTVNIKGEFYRLKETRKAGLLGKSRPTTTLIASLSWNTVG